MNDEQLLESITIQLTKKDNEYIALKVKNGDQVIYGRKIKVRDIESENMFTQASLASLKCCGNCEHIEQHPAGYWDCSELKDKHGQSIYPNVDPWFKCDYWQQATKE